jgi:hypothetical protein
LSGVADKVWLKEQGPRVAAFSSPPRRFFGEWPQARCRWRLRGTVPSAPGLLASAAAAGMLAWGPSFPVFTAAPSAPSLNALPKGRLFQKGQTQENGTEGPTQRTCVSWAFHSRRDRKPLPLSSRPQSPPRRPKNLLFPWLPRGPSFPVPLPLELRHPLVDGTTIAFN